MTGGVAAVLPLYNEITTIGNLVHRFPPDVVEVIVVDDGSDDGGPAQAAAASARVISLGARSGVGAAIRAGIRAARADGRWAVVVMAANGKDDPAEIPRLLAKLAEGYDYVQGSRFLVGGSYRNLPRGRRLMMKTYTAFFRVLTGRQITDVTNGFRAYRLALFDDPRIQIDQRWLDHYELEYYLEYKVLTLGYRFCEVPVSKTYPTHKRYSKIRPIIDWWPAIRPVILLALRLRH